MSVPIAYQPRSALSNRAPHSILSLSIPGLGRRFLLRVWGDFRYSLGNPDVAEGHRAFRQWQ
jgi:hypothetical protein